MSELVKVASKNEIVGKQVKAFLVGDRPIAIARIGEKFYAFDEICTHQYASLAEGWLEDYAIECPMHGAQFDVRTGEVLSLPALENIKTYEVEIRGDDIFVKLD